PTEEPCEGKLSSTVLKTSSGSDSCTEFNHSGQGAPGRATSHPGTAAMSDRWVVRDGKKPKVQPGRDAPLTGWGRRAGSGAVVAVSARHLTPVPPAPPPGRSARPPVRAGRRRASGAQLLVGGPIVLVGQAAGRCVRQGGAHRPDSCSTRSRNLHLFRCD